MIEPKIIPRPNQPFEYTQMHSKFFNKMLNYMFIVLSNDAFLDLVTEKLALSIEKVQRLIIIQTKFLENDHAYLINGILLSNFACLMACSNK